MGLRDDREPKVGVDVAPPPGHHGGGGHPILEQRADALLQGGYSKQKAQALKALHVDAAQVARRGLRYERLDQLLVEHLLGVRS